MAVVRALASTLATMSVIGTTAVMAVAVGSPATDTVAAIFPPWWSAARILQAAASAGEIVGIGKVMAVVIVHSDRGGLATRLRGAGALTTLNATDAGGCRSPNVDPRR